MLRLFPLACASLFLISAAKTPVRAPSPSPSPTASIVIAPLPISSGSPKVVFSPVDYYTTPAERVKILSAGIKANEVVQSQCFHDFIANRKLIQTNGRTPQEVADHLQSLSGVVPVRMYYSAFTSAMAYRQPPELAINLNRKFFNTSQSDCYWAATLGHESIGHSLGGYGHDFNYSPSRSYSVPYSIGGGDAAQGGDAFKKCCK